MEKYTGVKFTCRFAARDFSWGQDLVALNSWAYLLAQLGLAPIHDGGAYGNFSCRASSTSFFISKTAMVPGKKLVPENYCLIEDCNEKEGLITLAGISEPSSETFLHALLYRLDPATGAILHGHQRLLGDYADRLALPQTSSREPYGTLALAESALALASQGHKFFLLRDHGFIAIGNDLQAAGRLTLDSFARLVTLLGKEDRLD